MSYKRTLLLVVPIALAASLWPLSHCSHAQDSPPAAATVETAKKKTLMLNGSAMRTVLGFKVYKVDFYLTEPCSDCPTIYADRDPKRIHIQMMRDVSGPKFESTIKKNVDVNFSAKEKAGYKDQLTAFLSALVEGVELTKGTDIYIDYVPGEGTQVRVNQGKAKMIPGEEFYHALLRLWIGDPPQKSVRRGLLGSHKRPAS